MTDNNKDNMSRRSRARRDQSVDPGGSLSRRSSNINQRISNRVSRSNEDINRRANTNINKDNNIDMMSRQQRVRGGQSTNNNRDRIPSTQPRRNNNVYQRISKPKGTINKSSLWLKLLKYGLYIGSVAIIFIFSLCVYWIYQAPKFDSDILDNNHRTIVYDISGKEVAKLGNQIGDNATKEEIPQQMQDAILATEDNRFFEHGAVDYRRLAGAVLSNLTSGFGSQGGSTISQQLIKRTFLDDNKSIKRKVQEAYLAYKLEQNYDKDTIFNMYINRIYYSDGVYGLKTAANYYYDKELNELTLPQMALLAGMPQQPNSYNPYDHPENAKKRRDIVLYLMQYHGKITEEEAIAAQQTDILIGIKPRTANNRFILSSEFSPNYTAYMSQVALELKTSSEFKDYDGDVLNLGLKVYTNLDTKIQDTISMSVNNNLAGIKQASDVAMTVINNDTGGVAAIYGGKDFKFGGFNIATQSKLQAGSTMKPILAYAPAVEYLGWSTNHIIEDTKIPGSHIQNWDRQYHGNVTMNYALMMSFNIPAIKTYQQVGFNNVKKYANNVGLDVTDDSITTPIGGSGDGYSPMQMAAAYSPFANGGYYATPKTVVKVYDNQGDELTSFSKNDRKQVIKDSTAYIMTSMLRNVVGGTATLAGVPGVDTGVKTGTTTFSEADANKYGFDIDNAAKDSWIIGYNSKYTLSVWQGFSVVDGPTKFLNQQDTGKTQTLYRINMQSISKIYPPTPFNVPSQVGTFNGGLKVLTDEEKRFIENQARESAEKLQKEQEQEKDKEKTNKEEKENSKNSTENNTEKNSNLMEDNNSRVNNNSTNSANSRTNRSNTSNRNNN
ncbi:transglycosylase domain-containing protein [Gemelliphila palaticanis]|uniref:Penicillin-binding protein n=1 Tax=Gemelliphila palaticanis TaxID=81950 RepID=A0ABX2SXS4_9BACL|nr:transglycosylase domain-containing protein [Gemella palaticanis]MBF0715145.1 penicillin-binding protein [Gemella palaticanis]NYS47075.1 penicillin-binding protein [Gemella palaticanis]